MTDSENNNPATPEKDAGGSSGSTGTSQSSNRGANEDITRVGTKVDIRGADSEKKEEEPPAPDNLRDGN